MNPDDGEWAPMRPMVYGGQVWIPLGDVTALLRAQAASWRERVIPQVRDRFGVDERAQGVAVGVAAISDVLDSWADMLDLEGCLRMPAPPGWS